MSVRERLETYVRQGGSVRQHMDDFLAGRCGARLVRGDSDNGGQWCQRGAGLGTDHKGLGRCSDHTDQPYSEGLPPWAGEIPDEKWREITGGRANPGELTHGIAEIERARKTFEDQMRAALPDQDRQTYDSLSVEPVAIIDQDIKLNRTMAVRIWRFIKRRMQMAGPGATGQGDPKVRAAQATLIEISKVLARLMKTRLGYSELAEEKSRDDFMADLLSELPKAKFLEVAQNPAKLAEYRKKNEAPF